MNNIFYIKRFALLMKKECMENWRHYFFNFFSLFGIMGFIMFRNTYEFYEYILNDNPGSDPQLLNANLLIVACVFFLVYGLFFAASTMDVMKVKTMRISYLMLPASNFEKFFSRWLITTVVYVVAFFLILFVVDMARVACFSLLYPGLDIISLDFSRLAYPGDGDSFYYVFDSKSLFILLIALYSLAQSIIILGTTFWQKLSLVKTFGATMLIAISYFFICRWTILAFYHGSIDLFGNVLGSFHVHERISENQAFTFLAALLFLFTIVNWTISYFRFKESEIIERW